MKAELIIKGQSWKSRIYIFIYVAALILMVKLIFGVIGLNETSSDETNANKIEIIETK